MDRQEISNLLTPTFATKHVNSALNHFSAVVAKYQAGDWDSIAKAGKFIEAVLKALGLHASIAFPSGRLFKADAVMTGLGNLANGSFDDTIRLTIPRACRFIYDIASNRGARHDPGDVDANEMDASAVIPLCSWILAEMIRYAQKGAVDIAQAQDLVDSLMARRYPLIEEVDGRVYFHGEKPSAPDVALVALAHVYPKRKSRAEPLATITRHGFKAGNAAMALNRIKRLVDDDGAGNLRLLAPGLRRAEQLINHAL